MKVDQVIKKILGSGKTAADYPRLSKAFNIIMWLYTIVYVWQMWPFFERTIKGFSRFEMGEFLINYEGGFVRRGLLGEILFSLCQITGISDPRYIIIPFCVILFGVVLSVLIWGLNKYKIWWWILPLSICLGVFYYNLVRKDYLTYVLLIVVLYIYKNKKLATHAKLILITFICLLSILNYEASFFMFMPLVGLLIFDKAFRTKRAYKLVSCASVLIEMMIVFMSTGNENCGMIVQRSWHNLYSSLIEADLSESTQMMGWTIWDSLEHNKAIPYMLLTRCDSESIYNLLVWSLYMVGGLWIIVNFPFLCSKYVKSRFPVSRKIYGRIVAFQFVCLLPLFLGLSCDYGRLLSYICIVSLLTVFIVPSQTLYSVFDKRRFGWINKFNRGIIKIYTAKPALYVYIFVMCFLNIPFCGIGPFEKMFFYFIPRTALRAFYIIYLSI